METDLSISIVNYNTRHETIRLIDSIKSATHGITYEILLVDNGSHESIAEIERAHPDVAVIANPTNRYFTHADNQNLARATGRYVVSLNSDTVVLPGTFSTLINFLSEDPSVGAVVPRISYPDGRLQPSIGKFVTLKFGVYEAAGLDRFIPECPAYREIMSEEIRYDSDLPQEGEVLYGACIMVRKEVLETVGLKDESLVHGWDEYDWCRRMTLHGWKLCYVPQATILHVRGASRDGMNNDRLAHYAWQGFFRLYRKHFGTLAYLLLMGLWRANRSCTSLAGFVRGCAGRLGK